MQWFYTKKLGVSLFVVFVAGCREVSNGEPDTIAPTLIATTPGAAQVDISLNRSITATFDEEMDGSTFNDASFTLNLGGELIPSIVSVIGDVAILNPTVDLEPNAVFTVHISNEVTDLVGNTIENDETWTFITGNSP